MNVTLNLEGNVTMNYITINVRMFRDSFNCQTSDNSPDFYFYEVLQPPRDTIYSLESMISKKLPDKKAEFIMYGFPYYSFTDENIFRPTASLVMLKDFEIIDNYNVRLCDNTYKVNSFDYIIKSRGRIVSDSLYGYSGSPAFVRDRKSKKLVFLGTFHSTMENDKYLLVKPEIGLGLLK